METSFSLTHEDFTRCQRLMAKRIGQRIGHYSWLGVFQIGVWVLIGLTATSIYYLLLSSPEMIGPVRLFSGFLAATFLAVTVSPHVQRAALRKHLILPQGCFLAKQTVRLSQDTLRTEARFGSSDLLWSGFVDASQDDHNYYFLLDAAQAVIVPKAAASGEFKALLEQKLADVQRRQRQAAQAGG